MKSLALALSLLGGASWLIMACGPSAPLDEASAAELPSGVGEVVAAQRSEPKPSALSWREDRPTRPVSTSNTSLSMTTMLKQFVGANTIPAHETPDIPYPEKAKAACPSGSPGCRCAEGRSCQPGLECRWETCWGRGVSPPETYYYSERSERDVAEIRTLIAGHMNLQPGAVVADIGCGTGVLTLEAAQWAGAQGRVYAVDIDQGALDALPAAVEQLAKAGSAPVVPLLALTPRDTGLSSVPDASVDVMLMVNSVEFQSSEQVSAAVDYLSAFMRKLKPGGRLIYHFDWLDAKRLNRDAMVALFERAGFESEVSEIPMPAHIPHETYVFLGGGRGGDHARLERGFILVFKKPGEGSVRRD